MRTAIVFALSVPIALSIARPAGAGLLDGLGSLANVVAAAPISVASKKPSVGQASISPGSTGLINVAVGAPVDALSGGGSFGKGTIGGGGGGKDCGKCDNNVGNDGDTGSSPGDGKGSCNGTKDSS